ncbi:uncharacterized protein LOC116664121 [Camelus ferus]|uniref:Uncharacterized protein LOC116664121 n=1 Tax=Camelus ferus TaxID=419612 RepID=A0A8B8T4F9_CAMFR|nr:uncharacterized protein LOC116664121 [Camelus ferus]
MWRGAADAVPGTEAAWAPPDKVRGSAELALPGKKLLLAPSFCFFSSPGGFGFFDIILKLAPTGPCSSGSGSDSSSGTEREQNKSRHGKWCNSIHLQVNPSGEPSLVPSPHSAARGAGPTPGRGRQEARAARRVRPRPSAAASAAWRPPGRRRGPADPAVASASLLPRALLCALPLATSEELLLPATPGASVIQLSAAAAACEAAFLLSCLFPSSRSLPHFFRAFLQTSRGQIIAAQRSCRHS